MAMIFRPLSFDAAVMKPYAIKLASAMKGSKGVRHRVHEGFLLRAVGNGKSVTVYVLDAPIILALGVHGWVKIGLKAVDGAVHYEPGIRNLLSPPAAYAAPTLEYGQHAKPIEVVTIGAPSYTVLGESATHYAGYSLENSGSLTTTKARYAQPGFNNPFRQPFLVIHRATAGLGAGAATDETGTFGRLSALGRVRISIESLGTPRGGTDIIPGEALEWGPGFGCGQFAQSTVEGYLVFYKITEQQDPVVTLAGQVEALIDLPANNFTVSTGITSASAMTGQFVDDADRAVYFLSTRYQAEVQESVIHGLKEDTRTPTVSPCSGPWYLDDGGSPGAQAYPQDFTYVDAEFTNYKRIKETHLVKALPDGTVSSIKLVERWDGGLSGSYSGVSFSTFPEGYELNKIGAVLAPEIGGEPRQALIIALRTTYATVETPEVPAQDETIVPLWTCGELSEGVVLPKYPGSPATYAPVANTYEQAYSDTPIAIIREDGTQQLVSIPGYVPVGADSRGATVVAPFSPAYQSMRYRSVACEYAADYFCVLITPMPAGGIVAQDAPWAFHVAVIHKVTGALHVVTPALGTYPPYPGQIAISCIEQGVFVDGVLTQHARLLISVMEEGALLDSTTLVQPTAIYMLADLSAIVEIANTDYFAEAHYLGSSLLPATVGRSTGMTSRRTGVDPVA